MKKTYRRNIKNIISSPIPVICGISLTIILVGIGWYFIDLDLAIANLGYGFVYTEVSLYLLFSLLFGFFVAATVYKVRYFNKIGGKKLTLGGIGGFLGILVVGCPACSITFASYVGLASIIGLLPYNGLELKVIAILILLYAIHIIIKKLETCSLENQQQSFFKKIKKIGMKKIFVIIIILAAIAVSIRAIMNPNSGVAVLAHYNDEVETVDNTITTNKTTNNGEIFEPSTAPSGLCGNSTGGCGCGG